MEYTISHKNFVQKYTLDMFTHTHIEGLAQVDRFISFYGTQYLQDFSGFISQASNKWSSHDLRLWN